jgi:terminase small subunit-like protein
VQLGIVHLSGIVQSGQRRVAILAAGLFNLIQGVHMPAKKKGAPASTSKQARPKPSFIGKGGHKNHAANSARYQRILQEELATAVPAVPKPVVQGDKPRPKKYTSEFGERICMMFATDPTMSLLKMNRDPELPTVWTFYEWLRDHPELDKLYVRARELHTDLQADELEDIALTPMPGVITTVRSGTNADGTTFDSEEVKTVDMVERMKVRVAVRQWRLSKLRPKKYGVQPDSPGGNDALDELLGQFRARSKEIEDGG